MKLIDLATALSKLSVEQTAVLTAHLVHIDRAQADRVYNSLYAQILDSDEDLDEWADAVEFASSPEWSMGEHNSHVDF